METDIPSQREPDHDRQRAVAALRNANLAWARGEVSLAESEEFYDRLPAPHDSVWYDVGDRLSQFTHRLLHPFEKRK